MRSRPTRRRFATGAHGGTKHEKTRADGPAKRTSTRRPRQHKPDHGSCGASFAGRCGPDLAGTVALASCLLRVFVVRALRVLRGFTGGGRDEHVALAPEDDPVRALLLIQVEPLAVVAAHALALDDLRPADRAPLARLLADLAGVALGPALDRKTVRFERMPSIAPTGQRKRQYRLRTKTVATSSTPGRSTSRSCRTARTSRTARRRR